MESLQIQKTHVLPYLLATLALAACGGSTASTATEVRVGDLANVSHGPTPGPRSGLRLVFEVIPGDDASVEAALAEARARLDELRPAELSLVRRGRTLVVELGATSAEAIRETKAVLTERTALAVAPVDDAGDRLAPLTHAPGPEGFAVGQERVTQPDGTTASHTYAWTDATPDAEAARQRLRAWVLGAVPGLVGLATGHARFEEGPVVRTYLLGAEPTTFQVAEASAEGRPGEPSSVRVRLSPASAGVFEAMTRVSHKRRLAVMVRRRRGAEAWVDEVLSAPVVQEAITGGTFVLTLGADGEAEAAVRLARDLQRGGLAQTLVLLREETFDRR